MGRSSDVMKNISRTQAAKSGKRKPWFRGKYAAAAPKAIAKEEAQPKYYSTEDKKVKLTNSRCNSNATKLKASLVPGAVVILLAGRFKGKRAVFLKQLESGLCLITGPFKVNHPPSSCAPVIRDRNLHCRRCLWCRHLVCVRFPLQEAQVHQEKGRRPLRGQGGEEAPRRGLQGSPGEG